MVTAALVTLIRSFTLPGESVLDPFAGSGSSCAAALPTGRKYIGMEMDEKLNFQKLLGSFWRIFPRFLARIWYAIPALQATGTLQSPLVCA